MIILLAIVFYIINPNAINKFKNEMCGLKLWSEL